MGTLPREPRALFTTFAPTTRNTIVNAFAFEAALLLPYVYWLKLLQAHNEFMEDLTNA